MSREMLFWIALVFGVAAIIVYVVVLAMRPRIVRMLNGSGLFLTGLGLMQVAVVVRSAPAYPTWFNANSAVWLLSVAVIAQCAAVLRNRRAWDGLDRRGVHGGA
jgi:hypothetical protein